MNDPEEEVSTPCLNAQEVGAMVLEAAKYVAQAGLLSRRAARHTLGYRQRGLLIRLTEVLDSVVHPLCRTGRTLSSHEATRSRRAEPEVPENECCTAGVVQ